ncbi:TVP38/TMEM64 family protein [Halomonas sp. M4R1S46]|uniref:TVP38/TMEM64 family protein n=1 Tax=Halomonas sp. M4R1S46 TaxID=2982692 RepID=UPI0021E50810|nr:TVP38/TMEM64 family protein [Halomonas sp. M4R1S46]UYG06407.1 TVP38/TMEM64 family protein [Halomonas sp. M4R1S46]
MAKQQKQEDGAPSRLSRASKRRILLGVALLAAFLASALVLWRTGTLDTLLTGDTLEQAVTRVGPLGPALVIGLMTLAIVMSPIPSAPIALAAGAAYGHAWGTLYVAIGSGTGALIAFCIARLLGYDALRAWLGVRPAPGPLQRFIGSQNALMAAVFATRLMPFISFDVISYAAGLSPLKAWRFAVATLLGVLPASFLLAHFGDELASDDLRRAGLTVLALGTITLLPLAWKALPVRVRATIGRWLHWE